MTARRPLVAVSGGFQELSSTDLLATPSGSVADWAAVAIPGNVKSLAIFGWAALGDAPPSVWTRVTAQPSHMGRFRSADRIMPDGSTDPTNGGWWEIGYKHGVWAEQLGNKADNATDNATALANLYTIPAKVFRYGAGTFLTSATITPPASAEHVGQGIGRTILKKTAAGKLVEVAGAAGAALSLTSDAAAGQPVVNMATGDAATLSAGQTIILIGSTTAPSADRTVQFVKVQGVAAGAVTLMHALKYALTTAHGAYVLPVTLGEAPQFSDLTLLGGGYTDNQVHVQYARAPRFDRVRLESNAGLTFDYCDAPQAVSIEAQSCGDAIRLNYSPDGYVARPAIDDCQSGVVFYYHSARSKCFVPTVNNTAAVPLQANYSSEDCEFHGVDVDGGVGWGLLVDNYSPAKIMGGTIRRISGVGLHLGIPGSHRAIAPEVVNCTSTGIAMEDNSDTVLKGAKVKSCGTTASHHGIFCYGSVLVSQDNAIEGNRIDSVTGQSIYVNGNGRTSSRHVVANNIITNPVRGIRIQTSDYVEVKANRLSGAPDHTVDYIIDAQSAATICGDRELRSAVFTLSGADTKENIGWLPSRTHMLRLKVVFTEASDANTGIRLLVATEAGNTFLDIPAASATLVSQAAGAVLTFIMNQTSEGIKNGGQQPGGSMLYARCFGGKTGTGKVQIFAEIVDMGAA